LVAVGAGTGVPESLLARAVESAAAATTDDACAVAAAIEPWVARCDWRRYSWEQERLRDGVAEDRLTELWESRSAHAAAHLEAEFAGLSGLAQGLQTARSNSVAAATRLRAVETRLGFDPNEPADRLPVPAEDGDSQTPGVTELVPGAFGPEPLPHPQLYSRGSHSALLLLLARLPFGVRYSGPVVRAAGEVLARFRLRRPKLRSRLRLHQAWLRAKVRLRSCSDLVQIGWAIEVAAWQRANRLRRRFSVAKLLARFWGRLPRADVGEVNSFLALMGAVGVLEHPVSDEVRRSGWAELEAPGMYEHLPHTPVGRERDLVGAAVRAIFAGGRWDAETVGWLARLDGQYHLALKAGDLPGACWAALAERTRADELGGVSDKSTAYWREALSPAHDSGLRLNAAVVLICERVVRLITPDITAGLPHVLRSVLSVAERLPAHRRRAVTILRQCEQLLAGLGLPHLNEGEADAIREFASAAGGLPLPHEEDEALRRDLRAVADEMTSVSDFLEAQLGADLHARLVPDARAELRRGVWFYRLGRRSGCGLLNHAVHALTRAVHIHLDVAIWRRLRQDRVAFSELKGTAFINSEEKTERLRLPPKWENELGQMGFYPLLLRLCGEGITPESARWFRTISTDASELFRLHEELAQLVEAGRNASTHSRRMPLVEAEGAYNHLFRGGLLARLLSLLPVLR
jgi:hypothetical protein